MLKKHRHKFIGIWHFHIQVRSIYPHWQ